MHPQNLIILEPRKYGDSDFETEVDELFRDSNV